MSKNLYSLSGGAPGSTLVASHRRRPIPRPVNLYSSHEHALVQGLIHDWLVVCCRWRAGHDDIHLLDVENIIADANEKIGLDVEDDVWSTAVARLGLGNEQPVWGYVGPQTEQPIPSYPAYEPPTRMYDVNYTAM
ncbi:hypothetical protein V6N11_001985 [Hibiscus sabdariffa]|uniref:Uncharacterized protein n=1 Tax=Hibiscus sabdariffa TaxID=183260 RepID=A0ABR2QUA6_9ROSI